MAKLGGKKKKENKKPIRKFSSTPTHRNPAQLSMSILGKSFWIHPFLTKRLFSFILGKVPVFHSGKVT